MPNPAPGPDTDEKSLTAVRIQAAIVSSARTMAALIAAKHPDLLRCPVDSEDGEDGEEREEAAAAGMMQAAEILAVMTHKMIEADMTAAQAPGRPATEKEALLNGMLAKATLALAVLGGLGFAFEDETPLADLLDDKLAPTLNEFVTFAAGSVAVQRIPVPVVSGSIH